MIKRHNVREARLRRHRRVRERVSGTPERPRLSVFRSLEHIHVQIIDDTKGHTLVAASSVEKEVVAPGEKLSGLACSARVGEVIARRALAKGIKRVVFDRGGYLYLGRVKALAEAARQAGLEF